jgi:hypothetical protein
MSHNHLNFTSQASPVMVDPFNDLNPNYGLNTGFDFPVSNVPHQQLYVPVFLSLRGEKDWPSLNSSARNNSPMGPRGDKLLQNDIQQLGSTLVQIAEVLSGMKSSQDEIAKLSAHACKLLNGMNKRMDGLEASQHTLRRQMEDQIVRSDQFQKAANENSQK